MDNDIHLGVPNNQEEVEQLQSEVTSLQKLVVRLNDALIRYTRSQTASVRDSLLVYDELSLFGEQQGAGLEALFKLTDGLRKLQLLKGDMADRVELKLIATVKQLVEGDAQMTLDLQSNLVNLKSQYDAIRLEYDAIRTASKQAGEPALAALKAREQKAKEAYYQADLEYLNHLILLQSRLQFCVFEGFCDYVDASHSFFYQGAEIMHGLIPINRKLESRLSALRTQYSAFQGMPLRSLSNIVDRHDTQDCPVMYQGYAEVQTKLPDGPFAVRWVSVNDGSLTISAHHKGNAKIKDYSLVVGSVRSIDPPATQPIVGQSSPPRRSISPTRPARSEPGSPTASSASGAHASSQASAAAGQPSGAAGGEGPFEADAPKHAFLVMFPDHFLTIRVSSLAERDVWIKVINHAIASQLSKADRQSLEVSPRTFKKKQKQQLQARKKARFYYLRRLREIAPANWRCADCSSKSPEWGLTNWGVLICKECSAVHRGLGVHISRVQSLTLDRWPYERFQLIKALGNEKVNSILEAELDPAQKITRDCTREEREAFIQQKYQTRSFCVRTKLNPTLDLLGACNKNALVTAMGLIAQGGNVNCVPSLDEVTDPALQGVVGSGRSLLHCLILSRNVGVPVLSLLVENGANIEAVDEAGWTPLHCAAAVDSLHCARLLIENKAATDRADHGGLKPSDLAALNHSDQVGKLLSGAIGLVVDEYMSDDESSVPINMRLSQIRANAFEQIQLIRAKLTLLRHDLKSKHAFDEVLHCANLLRLLKVTLLTVETPQR